jgi:hypothetical protein
MFGNNKTDTEVRSAVLPSTGIHPCASGKDWTSETSEKGNVVLKGSFVSRREAGRSMRLMVVLPNDQQEGWLKDKNTRDAIAFGRMVRDAGVVLPDDIDSDGLAALLNGDVVVDNVFYVAFRRHTEMPGGAVYAFPGVAPSSKAEHDAWKKDPKSVQLPMPGEKRTGGGGRKKAESGEASTSDVDF